MCNLNEIDFFLKFKVIEVTQNRSQKKKAFNQEKSYIRVIKLKLNSIFIVQETYGTLFHVMDRVEKPDPVSLGILNMAINVLIHICLSPINSTS